MKYKIILIIEILLYILKFSFEVKAGFIEDNFKLKNAGTIYIEIFYSDSTGYRIPIGNIISPINKSDLYTNVKLISKNLNCGKEVEITLKRLKSKKIKYVDFIINFNLQFGDSNLIYFNNSFFTNAWAKIIKPDTNGNLSRELVLFRNSKHNSNLNIGFTTFNRFYTYFETYNNRVIVRQCMEDRALQDDGNYKLESFIIDESQPGDQFFDKYTSLVKKRYNVKIKPSPVGWSNWSYYYGDINEQKVFDDAKVIADDYGNKGAYLFQLDDGWYGKSWGDWIPRETKFSGGMGSFSNKLSMKGLTLGLWYAPTLFKPNSDLFHSHFDYNVFYDGKIKKSFGGSIDDTFFGVDTNAFYALNLANPNVEKYIYSLFNTAVNDYKSKYFKLDFLICSLLRQVDKGIGDRLITYPEGDYVVAEYRKVMMNIRKAVGDSVFLNACGAPIGESAGILDGSRISPDIIWGKISDAPNWWSIFKDNIRNVFLRSYFHDKFFVNDPDALVLRDFNNGNDFVKLSDNQAKLWATVIGMNGGTILINEDMEKLSEDRKKMFEQILSVWGKTAHPLDFFEQPYPTITQILVKDSSVHASLVAIYNLTDSTINKTVSLKKLGLDKNAIVMDCWSKDVIGSSYNYLTVKNLPSNSVKAMLVEERPKIPSFLFLDANIYMGADRVKGSYATAQRELIVSIDTTHLENVPGLYIYVPVGYKLKNYSEKNIVWKDVHGSVIKDNQYTGETKRVFKFEMN